MLSMLTPFGERSRGNRYPVAATAFVVAAAVGGGCLGVPAALGALAFKALDAGATATGGLVAAAAAVTLAGEIGWLAMPRIPRQVNEAWFGRYRAWVYGAGYGWQLGTGLTTYVMTTGVYLMAVLAALTASVPIAFAVCGGFGALRGLSLLIGMRCTGPDATRALHHRLAVAEPASRVIAVTAQVLAAGIGLAEVGPLWAAVVGVAVLAALGSIIARTMPSRSASAS